MTGIDEIPGGQLPTFKRRELHFYWLLDTSGSMSNSGKIQALNQAIRESIPHMQEAAMAANARGDIIVHAMEFNDQALWVDAEMATGVPVAQFKWTKDLEANGETFLGDALKKIAQELPNLPNNAFRPVIALVTDGQPTDDFHAGLKALTDQPWGKAAFRVAIAIGEDADLDVCTQFSGGERKPMRAHSVDQIKQFIRFVSHVAAGGAAKGEKEIEEQLKRQDQQNSLPPSADPAAPADGGWVQSAEDWVQ